MRNAILRNNLKPCVATANGVGKKRMYKNEFDYRGPEQVPLDDGSGNDSELFCYLKPRDKNIKCKYRVQLLSHNL